MIDDLYDSRIAATDATLLVSGTLVLVASEWFQLSSIFQIIGGGLVSLGTIVFSANMLFVIRDHSPHSLGQILFGSLDPASDQQQQGSNLPKSSREMSCRAVVSQNVKRTYSPRDLTSRFTINVALGRGCHRTVLIVFLHRFRAERLVGMWASQSS